VFEDFRLNVGSGGGVYPSWKSCKCDVIYNLFWISATRTPVTAARWWAWSPTDSHSGSAEGATYTSSGPSTPTHAAGSSASR